MLYVLLCHYVLQYQGETKLGKLVGMIFIKTLDLFWETYICPILFNITKRFLVFVRPNRNPGAAFTPIPVR